MSSASPTSWDEFRPAGPGTGAAGILLGTAFTFGLFLAMAHLDRRTPAAPPPDIVDLKAIAVAEPPPPPPQVQSRDPAPPDMVLTGLEAAAADSPVKLTVPLPELNPDLVTPQVAPPATIEVGRLYTELRPKFDAAAFQDRVYQMDEVDQIPRVLRRVYPVIPSAVQRETPKMRTTVLFVVEPNGDVRNVRIAASSGNDEFDKIIADVVAEWTFSPGVKRGKRVRCLMQQVTIVKYSGGNPFSI